MNKIIQSLWIGDRLSNLEQLCITSYLKNGHEFHLYTYGNVHNIPLGTVVKDANEIISSNEIFQDSHGGVAAFSDWFRYKLLYKLGGWWVDMDSVCLKFFDIEEEYCFSTEGDQEQYEITTGFIKAPPKAEFLEDLLEFIDKRRNRPVLWGEFGPSLLRLALQNYESKKYICPPETFCPIYWSDTYKLITKQDYVFLDSTYAVHFWNEVWRYGYLNKDAIYHPDSIYEVLKRLYLEPIN